MSLFGKSSKVLSLLLTFAMVIGVLPGTAFAAAEPSPEPETEKITLPAAPGGGDETINVTVTITQDEETGEITTEKKTAEGGDPTPSGSVTYQESTVTMPSKTEPDADGAASAEGPVDELIRSESSYTAEDQNSGYHAEGGSETVVEEHPITAPVEIPLTDDETDGANTSTVTGDPAGTTTTEVNSGAPATGNYDCTSETIIEQGSVSTTTKNISITETVDPDKSEMTQIASETVPTADNDLLSHGSLENRELSDGYEYVYIGTGNSSQFWASYLHKTPENEGDEPIYTDAEGTSYYYHNQFNRTDRYKVEGLYLDGKLVEPVSNKYLTDASGIFQFVMFNPQNNTTSTTYCADIKTGTNDGYSYKIVNLEDSDYYTPEEAARIRTIALNGYWGTQDDAGSGANGLGSLNSVKDLMRNAMDEDGQPIFTQKDIDALTDGIAMTATQYAIWTYSNKADDLALVNAYYATKDENNELKEWWQDIPETEQASVDLLFKLYDYLIDLAPTEAEQTTTDTLINEDHFLKDLSVTVVEKKADHENNRDARDDNDAYVVDLTFALVVTPSEENGDDLLVQVLDAGGKILASGRIAGELQEGETRLTRNAASGDYTFSGITMTEGDQNFNITLQGVQNLKQGVYLYTSEVIDDKSSQTMVGIAEGRHNVNVSMNIEFELSVNEEVVATEHVWRSERYDSKNGPWNDHGEETVTSGSGSDDEDIASIPDPGIPTADIPAAALPAAPAVEIPDEEIPMASVPKTGDSSGLWLMLTTLCGTGLMALTFPGKKREEQE